MRQPTAILVATTVAAALVACRGDRVPNGAWGGAHVSLTVTDNGGTLQLGCGHGTLDHPLKLDDRGRFSVVGTFVPEPAGEAPPGDGAEKRPARYRGTLERDKLDFTVTLEGQTGRGPFTVALGKEAKMEKCK
jgi:hypothetical protein